MISENMLERAKEILLQGGTVVFPTETVFGLGAYARNSQGVRRIFEAKGRPQDNPLIVHVADTQGVGDVARSLRPEEKLLFDTLSPGPLTLILPRHQDLAPEVSAGLDTVGVRIPSHPSARALLAHTGLALAAPSANRSGRPSPTNYTMALEEMEGRADLIIPGQDSELGLESTIVWLDAGIVHILRPGSIGLASILRVLRQGGFSYQARDNVTQGLSLPRAPGTRYRHYSPEGRVELWAPGEGIEAQEEPAQKLAIIVPDHLVAEAKALAYGFGHDIVFELGYSYLGHYAQVLYRALTLADKEGAGVIWLHLPPSRDVSDPEAGLAEALRDRARRAAGLY